MTDDASREVFTRYGLKNTRHRKQVYDFLRLADRPLAADEIYLKIRERDASISFSTVYRILDAFAAKGIAAKTNAAEGGRALFEISAGGHRHRLCCTGCSKTVPIDGCPLEQFEQALERQTSFDITAHRLELFGLCPECKNK